MASSAEMASVERRFAKDRSVGQKLAMGFAAAGTVVVLLVGATIWSIGRVETANTIEQRSSVGRQVASELRFAASDMRAEQLAYVMANGADRSRFQTSLGRFEGSLDDLRLHADLPLEVAMIAKISTDYQAFLATDQLIWNEIQQGNLDVARNLALGAEQLAFGFMATDTATYSQQSALLEESARFSFADTTSHLRMAAMSLGIFALTLVIAASWLITHLIRRPLLQLESAAGRAAAGDLSATAPVDGQDETGKLATAFNFMLRELRAREVALVDEHRRQETSHRIEKAFELADEESHVLDVISRALGTQVGGRPSEMLLTSGPRADLRAIATIDGSDSPGCAVDSLYSCPAVRAGKQLDFVSSSDIDACRYLRDRATGGCSATCLPVSFTGKPLGVIHSIGADGETTDPDIAETLAAIATGAGAKIGMLRTTADIKLQATTDPLTGLFNRRVFESSVRALHRDGQSFTLVMADLDHFKILNDTHGHEAGDRALTAFAEVLLATARSTDVVCRWGGEEFTLALVDASEDQAREMLDRIKVNLMGKLSSAGIAPFTASFGYVDASSCPSLEAAIRLADSALYEAKAGGRNRAVRARGEATMQPDHSAVTSAPRPDNFPARSS